MRRFLIPLLVLVAVLAAACGSDDTDAAETGETTTTAVDAGPTTSAPPESTDTIADDSVSDDGTDVDLATYTAIVSLNPTATEMLFAIGAGDQVIAVDNFSYYPPEAPTVEDLSAFDPNIEAIADLDPDLVVVQDATIVDQLDGLGIESLVLPAAETFDDTYAQIAELGELTGNEDEAAALVEQMQADIDAAVSSVEAPEGLTYYHELDNTLFSVTSNTFIGEVYGLFGLSNIADDVGDQTTYPQLTEEYVLTADPDLIFLADTLCCEQTAETVAERPGWGALAAVRNGTVIELDDDVASRWGPRIVVFVEDIAEALTLVPAAA